jgi:hypothetical protein
VPLIQLREGVYRLFGFSPFGVEAVLSLLEIGRKERLNVSRQVTDAGPALLNKIGIEI